MVALENDKHRPTKDFMLQLSKVHLIVLVLYVVLTLLMSWPLPLNMTTHIAGSGGDPWQTLWRFEYKWRLFQEAAKEPARLEGVMHFLREEFFGGGKPQLVNLTVWPWMWLHVVVGQPAAYNLIWLLSFVLSGYFMYLLASFATSHFSPFTRADVYDSKTQVRRSDRHVLHTSLLHEAPAFLAGLMYMFLPYHVAHAHGHFGALQTQWLPLIIFLLFIFIRRPTIWVVLLLAFAIIIQSWSEHHYALWLMIFGVLFTFFYWRDVRTFYTLTIRRAYSILLVCLLFFFVILSYLPTLRLGVGAGSSLDLGREQVVRFSADPFAYILPAGFHPLWGGISYVLFGQRFSGNEIEATQFLGLTPLLLVLFFHQRIHVRYKQFWLTVGVVFFVLSLGPRLHVLGLITMLPLPYEFLDNLPIFGIVRAIGRAGSMVGLALAVLMAAVLKTQAYRLSSTLLVGMLVLLEFLFIPFSLQAATVSSAYNLLRQMPGTAIIEIPATTNYVTASRALYATLIHGKKVVGNIALERGMDQLAVTALRSIPALRQLLFMRATDLLEERLDFFGQQLYETLPDALVYLDVGAIVVHADSLSFRQLQAVRHLLEEQLSLLPYRVDDVVLYDTRILFTQHRRASLHTDGLFLARDSNWRSVATDQETGQSSALFDKPAGMTIFNVTKESLLVELTFTVDEGSAPFMVSRTRGQNVASLSTAGYARVTITVEPGAADFVFAPVEANTAIRLINPQLHVISANHP